MNDFCHYLYSVARGIVNNNFDDIDKLQLYCHFDVLVVDDYLFLYTRAVGVEPDITRCTCSVSLPVVL